MVSASKQAPTPWELAPPCLGAAATRSRLQARGSSVLSGTSLAMRLATGSTMAVCTGTLCVCSSETSRAARTNPKRPRSALKPSEYRSKSMILVSKPCENGRKRSASGPIISSDVSLWAYLGTRAGTQQSHSWLRRDTSCPMARKHQNGWLQEVLGAR